VFEEGKFNETQKFSMLEDTIIPVNKMATIMRELSDWLNKNAPKIANIKK